MTTLPELTCPKCHAALPADLGPLGAPHACPSCQRKVEGIVFPAYFRPPAEGRAAEALVSAEDAGCFYHPQSRAVVPCDACGRFLCALCDVELQGQHLCPACVNSGRKKKRIRELDNERLLYGGIAFLMALLPMLVLWPVTIVTSFVAIGIAVYGWRKPRSLVGSGRGSGVLAIVLGLLQIGLWALVAFGIFNRHT